MKNYEKLLNSKLNEENKKIEKKKLKLNNLPTGAANTLNTYTNCFEKKINNSNAECANAKASSNYVSAYSLINDHYFKLNKNDSIDLKNKRSNSLVTKVRLKISN